jgi:hypothetical protein
LAGRVKPVKSTPGVIMSKYLVAIAAALALSVPALADNANPAAKKDSGSLSSGAKEAMPATKNQSTDPSSSSSSGASEGTTGNSNPNPNSKPMSSDPAQSK